MDSTNLSASQLNSRELNKKLKMAEATFERARKSLDSKELSVETKRYLNQLLTTMVTTEQNMSW